MVQENIAPVDGYVHLVHIFKRRPIWHGTSRTHLHVKIEEYAKKWSTFDLRLNSIILLGVSYVATQFHVSNSDGRMSKGVKNFAALWMAHRDVTQG